MPGRPRGRVAPADRDEPAYPGYPGYGDHPDDGYDDPPARNGAAPRNGSPAGNGAARNGAPVRNGAPARNGAGAPARNGSAGRGPVRAVPDEDDHEPLYARDHTPLGYDGGDPDDPPDGPPLLTHGGGPDARSAPGRGGAERTGSGRNGSGRNGVDRDGFDREGFDRQGFDVEGYDRDGFDRDGYDRDGYPEDDLEDGYEEYDEYDDEDDYDDGEYDDDAYGVGDGPLAVPPPGSGGRPLGPADVEELDPSMTDALARVDLGSIQVPVPFGADLTLEGAEGGRPQAVHLMLPEGRIAVSALAAPRSSGLWPELADEIEESLRSGGARVRRAQGDWGRELHARTENAASVFIGADGPRWMVYGVATAAMETVDALDVELRRVMRGIIVVRGKLPYPPRTVLPLEKVGERDEDDEASKPRTASITVSVPSARVAEAAPSAPSGGGAPQAPAPAASRPPGRDAAPDTGAVPTTRTPAAGPSGPAGRNGAVRPAAATPQGPPVDARRPAPPRGPAGPDRGPAGVDRGPAGVDRGPAGVDRGPAGVDRGAAGPGRSGERPAALDRAGERSAAPDRSAAADRSGERPAALDRSAAPDRSGGRPAAPDRASAGRPAANGQRPGTVRPLPDRSNEPGRRPRVDEREGAAARAAHPEAGSERTAAVRLPQAAEETGVLPTTRRPAATTGSARVRDDGPDRSRTGTTGHARGAAEATGGRARPDAPASRRDAVDGGGARRGRRDGVEDERRPYSAEDDGRPYGAEDSGVRWRGVDGSRRRRPGVEDSGAGRDAAATSGAWRSAAQAPGDRRAAGADRDHDAEEPGDRRRGVADRHARTGDHLAPSRRDAMDPGSDRSGRYAADSGSDRFRRASSDTGPDRSRRDVADAGADRSRRDRYAPAPPDRDEPWSRTADDDPPARRDPAVTSLPSFGTDRAAPGAPWTPDTPLDVVGTSRFDDDPAPRGGRSLPPFGSMGTDPFRDLTPSWRDDDPEPGPISRMAIEDIPLSDVPLVEATLDAAPVAPPPEPPRRRAAAPSRRRDEPATGETRRRDVSATGGTRRRDVSATGGTRRRDVSATGGTRRRDVSATDWRGTRRSRPEEDVLSDWMSAEIAARPSGRHASPGTNGTSDAGRRDARSRPDGEDLFRLSANGSANGSGPGEGRRRRGRTGTDGARADDRAADDPMRLFSSAHDLGRHRRG